MKFYEYTTEYQKNKDAFTYMDAKTGRTWKAGPLQFYRIAMEDIAKGDSPVKPNEIDEYLMRYSAEESWYHDIRPYYKVWPRVFDAIQATKLKVPVPKLFEGEKGTVLIRLPEGAPVKAILVSVRHQRQLFEIRGLDPDKCPDNVRIYATYADGQASSSLLAIEGSQLGASLTDRTVLADPDSILMLKIVQFVYMLKNDPEFVKPEVLVRDQSKFDETKDPRLVEIAKNHGIVGWSIGKDQEMTPHIRLPHFGHRWSGPGGKELKLTKIKGSIIHKDKLTRVPTGYILPDGTEVEAP